jgi:hypothetical protein
VPKENELPKGQAKAPQECPRQKVFFYPDNSRAKNRREKLVMDIRLLVQGLFSATRMKRKNKPIALILLRLNTTVYL